MNDYNEYVYSVFGRPRIFLQPLLIARARLRLATDGNDREPLGPFKVILLFADDCGSICKISWPFAKLTAASSQIAAERADRIQTFGDGSCFRSAGAWAR